MPQNSPPSLDKIFKRIFGLKNSNFANKLLTPLVTVVVILFLLIAWIASGIYSVKAGQKGLVFLMGNFEREVGQGVYWHPPYPLADVQIIDVSQNYNLQIGYRGANKVNFDNESKIVTADYKILSLNASLNYNIDNPEKLVLQHLCSSNLCENEIRQVAVAAIYQSVFGMQSQDLLSQPDKVNDDLQNLLRFKLSSVLEEKGVKLNSFFLERITIPSSLDQVQKDSIKARENASKTLANNEKILGEKIVQLEKEAKDIIDSANSYAVNRQIKSKALTAEFSEILQSYRSAPELSREIFYVDSLKKILSQDNVVIASPNSQVTINPKPKKKDKVDPVPAVEEVKVQPPLPIRGESRNSTRNDSRESQRQGR